MTAAVNKDVVPYWMQDYAKLAETLGLLCSHMLKGQPKEMQVICQFVFHEGTTRGPDLALVPLHTFEKAS